MILAGSLRKTHFFPKNHFTHINFLIAWYEFYFYFLQILQDYNDSKQKSFQ